MDEDYAREFFQPMREKTTIRAYQKESEGLAEFLEDSQKQDEQQAKQQQEEAKK